jgi:cellulose synthase/poly-beta-1,6-N-acetylglucosamine synthase-like glycosyltransferase
MLLLGLRRVIVARRKVLKNDPKHFIIQITTLGKAHESVNKIIDEIRNYKIDFNYKIWVVTEEQDRKKYPADVVLRVPKTYRTKNNSKFKTRALCYSKEKRGDLGLVGNDVKILFLDDDSLPSQEYMSSAFHANYDIAQGIISVKRNYGVSLLPSIQDSIRTSDCIAFCSFFNSRGDARIIHGEGLMVRSNVEQYIGWDFGDCLAEDLVFGRRATRKYLFGLIPEFVYIAPPRSINDFLKQRRRWFWGQIRALYLVDRSQKYFIIIRYVTAILGVVSYFFVFLDQIVNFKFSSFLRSLFMLNTVGWVLYYALGNFLNLKSLKWLLLTILLAFPAGFIELIALFYSIFTRPSGFDVIEK